MSGHTAFVTGATGFVGRSLVEALVDTGWRVTALHRPTSNAAHLEGLGVERVVGDVTHREGLMAAVPEGVDTVFHVAGSTSMWSAQDDEQARVNVDGARNVAEAALARGARRLVHTSSISAFGLQEGTIDEDAPMLGGQSPINYQRTKFVGEQVVREVAEKGLDVVILNPAAILGPHDTDGWARFIKQVVEGRLLGVPPGALSFCHVGAVARAHVAAATDGRPGHNYLLGGADATFELLTATTAEVAGIERRVPTYPAWLVRVAGRTAEALSKLTRRKPDLTAASSYMMTRRLYCDCTKAVRDLAYEPVGLREMVEETHRWLVDDGQLKARAHGGA